MNVLLLSMPDSFEHMPTIAVRMPNGALTSLAGNIDPHHRVAVADLVLVQSRVRETVQRLVREWKPQIVGLSVMTFQRRTACKIIELIRSLRSDIKIVVGGYDPSLAPESYIEHVDFLVRGEGEIPFRELLRALERGNGFEEIAGLSWRNHSEWRVNPPRAVHAIEDGAVALPNRGARVLNNYTFLGRQVDVIETSRGCTFDCGFCSIIAMRGRNFHTYPIPRVMDDIADAKAHGARSIFLVDDNVVLNVHRFEQLCQAIVAAGHNDVEYLVQAMTSAIAQYGEKLAPLMRRAGFRYVFLGIENVIDSDLDFLRAKAKNKLRGSHAKSSGENATLRAIEFIRRNGMYVVGGLIVGNPDDTAEAIETNLRFARRYIDWPYIQHPTPYPGTPMTKDFRERNLVTNERLEEYDGTTAVVRTERLAPEEIEFLRWRAERWMKVRHIPSVIRHNPAFVLKHWPRMLAHTFRGSTWKTLFGMEDERLTFTRYKHLRDQERVYL
jgi:anaerobic magnesium-protoporphyrin IX monomethyl ester cyclase